MDIKITLDLSHYTDNQIAMFLVDGTISRREFEAWKAAKEAKEHVDA